MLWQFYKTNNNDNKNESWFVEIQSIDVFLPISVENE